MLVPTGTTSLVLHRHLPHVDVSSLAQQVAAFIFPQATWLTAFSDRHTDETCLADLQYLHAQQIPESDAVFDRKRDRNSQYIGYTLMDEAAARGFLSVVQFLHKLGTIRCTEMAMIGASRNGHFQVVKYLHEEVRANVWWKPWQAWQGAAETGHLQVLQYLHPIILDLPAAQTIDDRILGSSALRAAVKRSVERNDVEMLKWLYATRSGRCSRKVLGEAATSGSAELVAFLYEDEDAYACRSRSTELVARLYNDEDGDGCRTVVSKTARAGRLDLIQYFHNQTTGRGFSTHAMNQAAENGHLDVVQFLHHNRSEGCTTCAMDQAAQNGHLDVVQFLDTHRYEGCTAYGMDQVATNGHLDVLQYIYENRNERCDSTALDKAAGSGHLKVVQFLYTNRRNGWYLPRSVSRKTIQTISTSGHADVLQYLVDQNLVKLDPEDFTLIPRGNVQMIKCMYDNCVVHAGDRRLPLLTSGLTSSMKWGENDLNLKIIQCLDSLRLPGDVFVSSAMDTAAKWGDLKLVECLHAHGHAGCTTKAMDDAAAQGHLDIIQFLHENRLEGCTTKAMDVAAYKGHLGIVQFLHEHRPDGCTTEPMDWAASEGHLTIVQFLHENRSEGCTTAAMDKAAAKGHLDIVQFLHENRREGCTTKAMDTAAENGHLDIVQFLHENRSEGCTTTALTYAFRRRHFAVAAYLLRHRTEGCGRPVLTFLAEEGCLDMIRFVFATRTGKDCVRQALESARTRCPARKRQAMVAYLESQLPCTCIVCSGEIS